MSRNHRRNELADLALSLGMNFEPKDDWGIINLMGEFKLFKEGFNKKIYDIISIKDNIIGFDAKIFDYNYSVSSGKSMITYRQTVFFIESRHLGLPHFWMRPEKTFDKVANWFGFNDIDFDTHPQFSENYYLKGEDADYIKAVMNDDFLHYFSFSKNWYLEGIGFYMILYNKHHLMPINDIRSFYVKGRKLFDMLKIKD